MSPLRGLSRLVRSVLLASCLTAGTALACEHASLVQIPDAANLSWNRYETLVPEVQLYLQGMRAYVECLREDIDDAEDAGHSFMPLLVTRNNTAVAEVQRVIELYEALNAELERMQREAP